MRPIPADDFDHLVGDESVITPELEALGYPLGRPETPAEAAEQLVRWMQGERERSAAGVATALAAAHARRQEGAGGTPAADAGSPPEEAQRP